MSEVFPAASAGRGAAGALSCPLDTQNAAGKAPAGASQGGFAAGGASSLCAWFYFYSSRPNGPVWETALGRGKKRKRRLKKSNNGLCLFHPLLFPAVGFWNSWLHVLGFLQASSSADSHVSLSSPAGWDIPRGKRLMVTAKAEQFSWRGAAVGMALMGQSACGFHGERELHSRIWSMSSALSDIPCARLRACSGITRPALQPSSQNLTRSWVKQGDCIVPGGVTRSRGDSGASVTIPPRWGVADPRGFRERGEAAGKLRDSRDAGFLSQLVHP